VTHERRTEVDRPNLWIGPAVLAVLVIVPIAILVISNPDSTVVEWAGFDWEAPRWLVLLSTFLAGLVSGPLLAWGWRLWRRRRRRLRDELEVLERRAESEEA
jgi:uncharacterized integral membrane protein